MSRATSPSPMMASTKLIQVRRLPEGAENPSVVTEEPLTSNDFC